MTKKWFEKKMAETKRMQEDNMVLAAIGGAGSFAYFQNKIAIEFKLIKLALAKELVLPFVNENE